MDGIGKDEAAVRYVVERLKPDGIISTRPNIVKCAKSAGIFTVLRVFLIDSQGLSSALVYADKICPDSVEIMPGLLPRWSVNLPPIRARSLSADSFPRGRRPKEA